MLLGYNKSGEIKFIFTDEKYLNKFFPNDSAKINNFWKVKSHGLKELFVPLASVKDFDKIEKYKVSDGRLTLKSTEENEIVKVEEVKRIVHKQDGLFRKLQQESPIRSAGADQNLGSLPIKREGK